MPEYVKYIVTPVDGGSPAVRITTEISGGPWVDDCEDIIVQAVQPDAVPLMQAYLSGLTLDKSWTSRESKGNAWRKTGFLPGGKRQVELNSCVESRRKPKQWFSLLFGIPPTDETQDFTDLLEVTMLDERLAEQMYDAVIAGTLQIEFALPQGQSAGPFKST